jgi:hypothetical protein
MYTPTELLLKIMYNEILKDRMEAAILLSEKLKVQNKFGCFAVPRGGVPLVMKLLETYNFL